MELQIVISVHFWVCRFGFGLAGESKWKIENEHKNRSGIFVRVS